MIATIGASLFAGLLGVVMPLSWGAWGYVGVSVFVFSVLVAIMVASGTVGYSLQDGILLFEGSVLLFGGFVAKMAFGIFAMPLFVLSAILIVRFRRVAL